MSEKFNLEKWQESRRFSDPSKYDNSIDCDDAADGREGGYTKRGISITPDAMKELVALRAENQRLRTALGDLIHECVTWDDAVTEIMTVNPRGDWLKPYKNALAKEVNDG